MRTLSLKLPRLTSQWFDMIYYLPKRCHARRAIFYLADPE